MTESVTRGDAEALVRKALCSCFLAVDGTITLRMELVPDAARAVTSCLTSHGLLERGMDASSVEKLIYGLVQRKGEIALPVSAPATVVASRICSAMRTGQMAA